jgi:2-methylcitrate dehydratase PrpD
MNAEMPTVAAAGARPPASDLAMRLAAVGCSVRWEDVPHAVRARVALIVLDTVGAALAGSRDTVVAMLAASVPTASPGATAFGLGRRVGAGDAALLNGAAAIATQLDEGHRATQGHPALHVVPAALAVAETRGARGEELLTAVLAGYEVAVRTGEAFGILPPHVHPHGHWPIIGAACAVALLCGGDEAAVRKAIDGASAFLPTAPARTAGEGAGLHHLYAGVGTRNAITIGIAAAAGMTASDGLLAEAVAGADTPSRPSDEAAARDDTARRWSIREGYFKLAPLCAHTLSAWEAARELHATLAAEKVDPLALDAVTVATYGRAALLDGADPRTPLAAKFSVPYAVAAGIDGREPATLLDDRWHDARLTALMERVTVTVDPALDALYPLRRPAEVTAQLPGGGALTARCMLPRGDSDRPIPDTEVVEKFTSLATPVLGADRADALATALLSLADAPDVAAVLRPHT